MKFALGSIRMCSALLLAASSIGAAAAHADPNPPTGPAGSSEIDRYMEAKGNTFLDSQKQLSDFKHWITEQPGIEQAGYVEQVNNAETRSSKILWKGPSILRDAVKTEGQARGISVTFSERPYSLPEIRAAIKGIDAQKNAIAALGFQIEGIVGVRDDDGAIAVEGHAIGIAVVDTARVAAVAKQAAGTAVRLVDGKRSTPATRSNDSSPFNSGAYMQTTSYSKCTTGFALADVNRTYTITARHCPSGPWYDRNNFGVFVGNEFWDSAGSQSSLMTGYGSKWMYDGTWDNSWGYSKATAGFQDVSLGDWICTSGGNSGVHCGIQVEGMWYLWDDGYGSAYNIEAFQMTHPQIAAIQGDSGGPVLMPYSNGTVGAVGMIQAVLNARYDNCGSVHDPGYLCSAAFLFTSTRTIANSYGLSLVTW